MMAVNRMRGAIGATLPPARVTPPHPSRVNRVG
jgi:hypothetical protein